MASSSLDPLYVLRRAGSNCYVRTDDGETFDVAVQRELASAFCSHIAPRIRSLVERETGKRYRMVFVGCNAHDSCSGTASASINRLAVRSVI